MRLEVIFSIEVMIDESIWKAQTDFHSCYRYSRTALQMPGLLDVLFEKGIT
jgi:hypothetical protein